MVEARMASSTWPGPGSGSGSSRRSVLELPGRITPRMGGSVRVVVWATESGMPRRLIGRTEMQSYARYRSDASRLIDLIEPDPSSAGISFQHATQAPSAAQSSRVVTTRYC
ncbi:hypothetical protein GCM10022236_39790 [Microlunatus ginsengisoli]|uniref:Uncharacterized protein n=1 Tax=Microlunatus ginsengisoli TaxID=363863 RepID=A0ABP7AJ04_9ACTN